MHSTPHALTRSRYHHNAVACSLMQLLTPSLLRRITVHIHSRKRQCRGSHRSASPLGGQS